MENILTNDILERFIRLAPELETAVRTSDLELRPTFASPFEMLVKSVVYQQLSGKAAKTILDRLINLVGELTPESILLKSQEELRTVGLSRQKASYVRNIAEAFGTNGFLEEYNSVETLKDLSSDEICNLFSQIKGVGEWTVQMYLIFSLGRLDVLAPNDLGVRKGIQILYNLRELPTPKEVREIGSRWSPLETVGTCLAWRAVAIERAKNRDGK